MDYVGVPFKCLKCHRHRHLASDCSLSFHKSGGVAKSVWRVKKSVVLVGVIPEEGLFNIGLEYLEDGSDILSHPGLELVVQNSENV